MSASEALINSVCCIQQNRLFIWTLSAFLDWLPWLYLPIHACILADHTSARSTTSSLLSAAAVPGAPFLHTTDPADSSPSFTKDSVWHRTSHRISVNCTFSKQMEWPDVCYLLQSHGGKEGEWVQVEMKQDRPCMSGNYVLEYGGSSQYFLYFCIYLKFSNLGLFKKLLLLIWWLSPGDFNVLKS